MKPTDTLASSIMQAMKQLVHEKLPIECKSIARSELEAYFASKSAQVSLDFVKSPGTNELRHWQEQHVISSLARTSNGTFFFLNFFFFLWLQALEATFM